MNDNPYQAPQTTDQPPGPTTAGPTGLLIALCALSFVFLVLSLGIAALGLASGQIQLILGGLVLFGFYTAITVGLMRKQEWARLNLIWLCYVGIVAVVLQAPTNWLIIPDIVLNVITLVIAHSAGVREQTRRHSLADSYIYVEPEAEADTQTERETP